MKQQQSRVENHSHSERSKCKSNKRSPPVEISIGDLVYIKSDRNKCQARDRYIVVAQEDEWCFVRKFKGSQLCATSYKVRQNDCFTVPCNTTAYKYQYSQPSSEVNSSDDELKCSVPHDLPNIPVELSVPPKFLEKPSYGLGNEVASRSDPSIVCRNDPSDQSIDIVGIVDQNESITDGSNTVSNTECWDGESVQDDTSVGLSNTHTLALEESGSISDARKRVESPMSITGPIRHSGRARRPPRKLQDYVTK
jgi:hypothetical protein